MANPAIVDIASEIGNLLKIHYGPSIVEQTNMAPMLWKMFDQSTVEFAGDHYEFPARMVFPQTIGPRSYGVGLPPSRTAAGGISAATDVTAKVFHKYLYASFDITGPDMERARNKTDAFVVGLSDRMASLTRSFTKDANFQTYLSGTGIYTPVRFIAGGGIGANQIDVDTAKYLRIGRRLDFWDDSAVNLLFGSANSSVLANFFTVTAIDPKGGQLNGTKQTARVTLSNNRPAGIAVPDGVMPETGLATASTAVGIFLNGLGAIVDDGTNIGTFQGINRTTFPQWKASIFGNSGTPRDLTLQLMQLLVDVPETISGQPIDLIVGSYNARNQYLQLLVSQKRFMAEKADGGFPTLEYNGKTFLVDVDCQDDSIYGLNRGTIKRFGLFEPKFDDSDGNVLKYTGTNGDTFVGFLKMYGNLGTEQANANAKIADLNVDSSYLIAA